MAFQEVTIGPCRLICADCMSVLPTLSKVDAVVTDPPYGLGRKMQGGTWGAADKYADLRQWDVLPSQETICQITDIAAVSVIWGGNHFTLPPSRGWLIWDKQNAVPTMSDVEMAWTNIDRPAKRFSHPVATHRFGHPSEKPEPLIVWTLRQLPKSCKTVLDPYLGSGTTAAACISCGIQCIGIEASPKYFEIACKRIQQAWDLKCSELPFEKPTEFVQKTFLEVK